MVTLIAVYTVVLVLLKDQWWYVLKLSGARNEPGSHWCVGAELSQMLTAHSSEPLTSAIGGALDLKQLSNRRLESKAAIFKRELGLGLESATNPASACSPFKRSFLFQYKTSRKRVVTALCCWYSFPFHVILSKPVQSRRLLMWRRVNQPNEHKEDSRWWWDLISIASIRERPFVLDVPSTSYLCW